MRGWVLPKLKNQKHESFCQNYVKHGGNITKAMLAAGYSHSYANDRGYELSGKIGIKARIEELQKQALKRNEMEIDDIVQWLVKASTLKIDQFAEVMPNGVILKDFDEIPEEWKPFIQEITNTNAGGVQIKFIDKLGAIKELAKILGAYEKDNAQKQVMPVIKVIQAKDDGE